MNFSVGLISFAVALFGVLVVYGNFWVRRAGAWYNKSEPPKDRVHFGAIAFGVIFFALGCVVQAEADKIGLCTDAGYKPGECFFKTKH